MLVDSLGHDMAAKCGCGSVIILYICFAAKKIKQKKSNREKLIKRFGEEYVLKQENEKNANIKRKIRFLYKEILAIIIPIIPLIVNAVNDAYYYGATLISLVLIVLSFYDLVKEHNLLVSNKLPQLEKRGGDENE